MTGGREVLVWIDQHKSWKGRLDSQYGQVLRGEVFPTITNASHAENALSAGRMRS